jgi:hypothetical protein
LLASAWSCTPPSQKFVESVRQQANEQCAKGNQPACDTVVQALDNNRVGIQTTGMIPFLTPKCESGDQDACQQAAVMHVQLSSWCMAGNDRACLSVKRGPWPKTWDEASLIDKAKLSCLSGHFKEDSTTCQALISF